jgi:glucose/arabinose dehydrogenase
MKPWLTGWLRAFPFAAACALVAIQLPAFAQGAPQKGDGNRETQACGDKDAGITLPADFCATVFADNIGHARHMAVAPNGVVYVNTWSSRYYGSAKPRPSGFIAALQDTTGNGYADVVKRFGESPASGGSGGTGIALYNGALYVEEGDRILRYTLPAGSITPSGPPDVIVSGFPLTGDHPMHPFAIDAKGNLYVDSASATNSCQVKNRMLKSPGINPCKELEVRAGIWRYDANRTGQKFSPAERFATGLRNGEGIAFDRSGRIYATQHGRDQLAENWPGLYMAEEGANEPAEELVELYQGADYGWPECYYDDVQQKLVLAPEYGGDGGKTEGQCLQKQGPIAFFPAHWAPNDLLLYYGEQFHAAYRGGAFIAFHGSWNRAPSPQGGYNVVFQPFLESKPSGQFVVFADGFAGPVKEPGTAWHRPSGLAMGPDGALYISDDVRGRIWRVTFHGDAGTAGVESAPTAPAGAAGAPEAAPPEGINPEAGSAESLPVPPGTTAAEVALGSRIFHGQTGGGTCAGCHGSNGKGSPVGPDLTTGTWLWGDGSLAAISRTITAGVAQPRKYTSPMPPLGGAQLSPSDVVAVAAYVWAIGHQDGR